MFTYPLFSTTSLFSTTKSSLRLLIATVALFSLVGTACGSDTAQESEAATEPAGDGSAAGVRVVSVDEAAAIYEDPPPDLFILDVRTPEEFAEGHLEGAVMLDFYREDFAEQLAELDPDQPYLLYCRSGNRSGQARELMAELEFTDVADMDGGIVAWTEAGYPTLTS